MKMLLILLEVDYAQFTIQVLQFLIPALIVFGVSYTILHKFLNEDYRKRLLKIKEESTSIVLPHKLQAYERLTIFLERISPDNLILRSAKPSESATEFKVRLISSINEEYNHNIAQQLYVSHQAWNLVQAAKNQVISVIENAYKDMSERSSGPDLGTQVMKDMMKKQENICQLAIAFLKREIELNM